MTEAKPVRGYPGFTTTEWTQAVGLGPRPRKFTDLWYEGERVERGSRADLLALLKNEATRARWIREAKARACDHFASTLVATKGLGSFNPIEVYRCDACGTLTEQPYESDND